MNRIKKRKKRHATRRQTAKQTAWQFKESLIKLATPTKEEEALIARVYNNALNIIQKSLNKNNINAKAEIGGSVAKGTWLKDINDIDVYVKFNREQYSARNGVNISILLGNALKGIPNLQRMHGSRDYFQFEIKSNGGQFTVEVIPILDISRSQEAENITDISPFHVRYVAKFSSLAKEMRLTKAFCKANNLYGAESYIKGFSGYAIEVLIAYYGSFSNLIKNASIWKEREVIDPSVYYKSKEETIEKMNISKQQSPLILVDPVQEDRNAAAAVGIEKYKRLIALVKRYLKNPSARFFIKEQFDANKLIEEYKKQKARQLIVLKLIPKEGKKDIVGARLLKCFEAIEKALRNNEFKILSCNWNWDNPEVSYFWFVLSKEALSRHCRHYGPPIKYKARLESFKKRWKGKRIYYEKGRVYILLRRKYREPLYLIEEFIKIYAVKESIKSIGIIKQ